MGECCSVMLTANAGLAIQIGGKCVLVDALHRGGGEYSGVPKAAEEFVLNMNSLPDIVLAGHCHADHWSAEQWRAMRARFPEALFAAPVQEQGTTALNMPIHTLSRGGIKIEALRMPHQGTEYSDVANYAFWIESGGCAMLICGDSAIKQELFGRWLLGRKCDVMAAPFPWLVLSRGRKIISGEIKPEHLLICHLPAAKDDVNGYREKTEFAKSEYSQLADIRLLTEPMQTERLFLNN